MKEVDVKHKDDHSHHIHGYILAFLLALLIGYAVGTLIGKNSLENRAISFVGLDKYMSSMEDYKPLESGLDKDSIVTHAEKYTGGRRISSIGESKVPGWYEILAGDRIFYLSHDKRYIFTLALISVARQPLWVGDQILLTFKYY